MATDWYTKFTSNPVVPSLIDIRSKSSNRETSLQSSACRKQLPMYYTSYVPDVNLHM